MFDWIFTLDGILSFITLVLLEIVLGIDNIIFLTILVSKLPKHLQNQGRYLGLFFAMLTRILLLFSIVWLSKLTATLFTVLGNAISGRDLVLIGGGVFLVLKSIKELLSMDKEEHSNFKASANLLVVIIEIAFIDIVFSLDSVITAVGIASELSIMVLAVIIAVLFMMFASKWIGDLVNKFYELKTLALTFLVLVGGVLVLEGLEVHVDKAYIYVALAFSLINIVLNIRSKIKNER